MENNCLHQRLRQEKPSRKSEIFNLALVNQKIVYKDESNKRLGYDVKGGKKSLSTDMIYNVTARSGVYKRKKKRENGREISN